MKMTAFKLFPCLLMICIIILSCKKTDVTEQNNAICAQLAGLHAHTAIAVTKGQQIDITADSLLGAFYSWRGPGSYQSDYQNNTVAFYANYSNEGWYYLTIAHNACADDRYDSVYVDVKFPQGTAPCTPANNSASFGGPLLLGDQAYSFLTFGAVTGGYGVTANSSNGDLHITMSPYWLTHDFEDGIYYTSSNQLPDYADLDKVFISDVNQSIYWVAEPDKPVYISHVAGKQRITFCGIQFSGDWGGTLYHTTVAGQVTQP
ncbi:hypothetical protein BH11BAC4_BH11BAC4_10700 [soil metagenome]